MFRTRTAARLVAATSAVALVLPATGAYADNLVADGDVTTTVADNALAFGNVCSNTTVHKAVALTITRSGGGSNTYRNSSTVTLSSPGLAFPNGTTITMPSDWFSKVNGTISPSLTARASFTAGATLGSVTGSISVTATGVDSTGTTGASLIKTVSLPTSANVVSCDTTGPTLSLPQPIAAEATSGAGAVVTYTATATDTNPANPTVSCTSAPTTGLASGSTFPLGTTTMSCSATDAAGNRSTGSFTVTVRDTTKPVLTGVPSNITKEATGASGATASWTAPTATDAVSTPTVGCTSAPTTGLSSGSTFPLGTTTMSCSATDAAGNKDTATFTVTVQDTEAPVIGSITAPQATEATSGNGAVVTFTAPTANDTVDGAVSVACATAAGLSSGDTFSIGTHTLACIAVDAAGNRSSESFDLVVKDGTAPTLVLPDNITDAEATSPQGAVVEYIATASDIVDGAVTPVCAPASGSEFGLGDPTTVGCSAKDRAGNEATGSFTVQVVDTIAPVLTEMTNLTREATSANGAAVAFTAPTATDAVGAGPVSCTVGAAPGTPVASGATFPIGTTTVTCSAKDAAGNTGSEPFTVTVEDTTAPVVGTVGPITQEATSGAGAVVTYTVPTATDAVGAGAVTCSPVSGATFAVGSNTVTCSAKDAAGNEGTSSSTVSVVDATAPKLSLPANLVIPATGPNGANATWTAPSADDLVDGSVPVTCSATSGDLFPIGTTAVECSAVDAAKNKVTSKFAVTVERSMKGFYAPIDTGRTLNSVKNGSTLPLKFEVFAGTTELTATDIFKTLSAKQIACPSSATIDEIEELTTGLTSVRYDATGGQYIWNWKTPAKANTCWQVAAITTDGAALITQFKLR